MKSRYWILLIASVLLICIALSLWLFSGEKQAVCAQIWSDGVLVETFSLFTDKTYLIDGSCGSNTITVKNGAVAVTDADCPDHHCMKRGYCSGGMQIVCLPNRLVIRFVAEGEIDAVVG